jgi:hypothetical protein
MAQSQPIKSISNLVLAMSDKKEQLKRISNRRSPQQLTHKLYKKSSEGRHESNGNDLMKKVRVHSNFARSRVVMLDTLVLHFDEYGDADFPKHQLPVLQAAMRARPGRYTIYPDTESSPALEPQVSVPEEVVEEVSQQVKDLLVNLKAAEETGDEDPTPTLDVEVEVEPVIKPAELRLRKPKKAPRKRRKAKVKIESTEDE